MSISGATFYNRRKKYGGWGDPSCGGCGSYLVRFMAHPFSRSQNCAGISTSDLYEILG
jgi:hypothetical protein